MSNIIVETSSAVPAARRAMELVERKGVGHPDSICDAVMESAAAALCREYIERVGRPLHYNLDKSLLVAGQSAPALGGGQISVPMRLIFGDRASDRWSGGRIPVAEIVEAGACDWFRGHLRHVDPGRHLVMQNEIRPGSPELVDIFSRGQMTANDTSAAVGFAPLSETESLVLAAENYLNSPDFKQRFPETGEDVKVMAVRRERLLHLTVAMAFVDGLIVSSAQYFERKAEIVDDLTRRLNSELHELNELRLELNTLDDPRRGESGMYLTVLGTSAEGADGGEVGRGNRVNGLISFHRPMTMEAAAGKNAVSHVGKIYNVLSHDLARRIHAECVGIEEVYVWLCSQIGRPLGDPWAVSVELRLTPGIALSDVHQPIQDLIGRELAAIDGLTGRLCRGEIPVC
jgi:S-adenosylmethionine synthetase